MSSPALAPEAEGEKPSQDEVLQPSPPPQKETSPAPLEEVIDLTLDNDDDLSAVEEVYRAHGFETPIKEERTEEASRGHQELPELAPSIIIDDDDDPEAPVEEVHQTDAGEKKLKTTSKQIEEGQKDAAAEGEGTEDMEVLLQTFLANRPNQVQAEAGNGEVEIIDSDEEDARATAAFQELKKRYDAKKRRRGKVDVEDDIDYQRAVNTEEERKSLRTNKQAYKYQEAVQDETSMFIPEKPLSPQPDEDDIDHDRMTDVDLPATRRTDTNSVRDSYEIPTTDDELQPPVRQPKPAAKRAGRRGPRGGRAKTSRDAVTKPTRARKVTTRGVGKGRGRGKGRTDKQGIDMIDTNSLFRHNIIEAATANRQQAPQPKFLGKNRDNALRDLIASMPDGQRDLYHGDKIDLGKAAKKFNCSGTRGNTAMRLDGEGGWKLRGMNTSLKNYQLSGASFLRDRENSKTRPFGGLLSDEMGLGKTVMMIANIIDGIPLSTGENVPRTTLIVVPPALTTQWMKEIDKHTDGNVLRDVVVYRSGSRVMATNPIRVLANNDIVITSYHEVLKSMPKNEPPIYLVSEKAKADWWEKEWAEKKGVLHCIKWHRIVLDEGQAIKNHLSKTSEAVCHLQGKFRWAISGTPIQNGLEEFYAFFRFLRCNHTGSFELFKKNFCKRGSDAAIQRLQTYLAKIMCRRTHEDKMFGAPILILPPIKPVETIEVEFNAVERAIYHIVRTRFIAKLRALSNKDNVDKHYRSVFVLLLRLRQLVSSPLLIQKTLKELLETEDLERLWQLTETPEPPTTDDGSRETLAGLEAALKTVTAEDPSMTTGSRRNSQTSSEGDILPTPTIENEAGPALSSKFRKYLQSLHDSGNWERANDRSLCHACARPPVNPHITSCMHMYCETCLRELKFDAASKDEDHATCLECGLRFKKAEAYAAKAFDEAGGRTDQSARASGRVKRKSSDEEEEDIDWFTVGGPVLQSAKTKGAVKKMKEWWAADKDAKIIIFVQFRALIKLFRRICQENCWDCTYFHGAMTFDARDLAIKKFTEDPNCKVMLAALKAGGVGLNLVAANRVIICDLWWNQSVETQAWCRVFRIGQERDVEVARFVVKDSVDTDVLKMQERKTLEVESAMEEKNRPARLTIKELLRLFGPITTAEDDVDGGNANATNGEDESFTFVNDPYEDQDEDEKMGGMVV